MNEEDITFNCGSDDDTLKAFGSKPILIKNNAPGYILTYYLDKFEYYKKSYSIFFTGTIFFNMDLSIHQVYNGKAWWQKNVLGTGCRKNILLRNNKII